MSMEDIMKTWGISLITVGLLASLLLVCASASGCIAIPLPVAVLVALGLPDVLLLLWHRRKMGLLLHL
jgi:hypothetical protein